MSSAKKHTPITDEFAQAFIDRAHEMFHDEGVIEVDTQVDTPKIHVTTGETVEEVMGNGGLYAKAWVWVGLDDLTEEARVRLLGKEKAAEWEASRG